MEANGEEEWFWRNVPQSVWDQIVQKHGVLGVDHGQVSSAAIEKTVQTDPQIHKYVDVTTDGLRRFFDGLDTNLDGVLDVYELHEGFQRTLNDFEMWSDTKAFEDFWKVTWSNLLGVLAQLLKVPISTGSEIGPFSFEAFCGLLRRFKLELILRDTGALSSGTTLQSVVKIDLSGPRGSITTDDDDVVLKSYCWNPRKIQEEEIDSQNMHAFYLQHRDPRWAMRWICLDSSDRFNIVRLSVKYRWHPLHLEDVLKLDRQQARFLKYGGHYFVILPLLRLMPDSKEGTDDPTTLGRTPYKTSPKHSKSAEGQGGGQCDAMDENTKMHEGIRMEKSRIAIFASGPPSLDTIITIHGQWKAVRSRCTFPRGVSLRDKVVAENEEKKKASAASEVPGVVHDSFLTPRFKNQRTLQSFARRSSESFIGVADEEIYIDAPTSVLNATADQLHEEYSAVRQGNSNWMLHSMIDTAVKMFSPIVAAYEKRLKSLMKELDGPNAARLREKSGRSIMDLKQDLVWLQQRLKQLKPLVRGMMAEPNLIGDEVVYYVQSVDDDLEIMNDDIATMLNLTQGLLDEAKYIKDDTRNESLKLFAVLTTCFVPLQFLCGYFGMNFANAEGISTIPLMNDPHGPMWFWIFCAALAAVFLYYIRFNKKWI